MCYFSRKYIYIYKHISLSSKEKQYCTAIIYAKQYKIKALNVKKRENLFSGGDVSENIVEKVELDLHIGGWFAL